MTWLANNWDLIVTLFNTVGLIVVNTKKANK